MTAQGQSFAQVLDLFFALLALSVIISVFGMINTLVLAVVAGIGAAVLPARRGARLNVLHALHYEWITRSTVPGRHRPPVGNRGRPRVRSHLRLLAITAGPAVVSAAEDHLPHPERHNLTHSPWSSPASFSR